MPRKSPKLILAAQRADEARRVVASQRALIARLRALRQPTLEAELYLQAYIGALEPLQAQERKLMEEHRAKYRKKRD